jgi:putative methyltransferase (TIGR04325 family)
LEQIRFCARPARAAARLPLVRSAFRLLRALPGGTALLNTVLGYQRVYATLPEAQRALAPYANFGHQHPDAVTLHINLNVTARPSDRIAFCHIEPLLAELRTVYDVGGNAGNLYFCYKNYLTFRPDLVWTVNDLPAPIAAGRALAVERGEYSLKFTDRWEEASGTDLMLISGALHYFEEPLASRLHRLKQKPRYILINRTPLTARPTVGAVQDAGTYQVACLLLNRDTLIQGLLEIGYNLLDSWRCEELNFTVPANPDYDVGAYSGLWFRLRDDEL